MTKLKREKATPELILASAVTIAKREGWQAVTIRKMADELNYTSPLIYEHFKNKDEVLTKIMHQGFVDLERAMIRSSLNSAEQDPALLIQTMSCAYWRFAQANPEIYNIMHGMDGVALDRSQIQSGAKAICNLALEAISEWAKYENLKINDLLEKTELLWCTLHGVTCLGLINRLTSDSSSENLIIKAVLDLLAGWKALNQK